VNPPASDLALASTAPATAPQKTPVAAPLFDRGSSGAPPSAQIAAAETATPKELPLAHAADGSDSPPARHRRRRIRPDRPATGNSAPLTRAA